MDPSPLRDPHSNRTDEPKDYNILNPLAADGSNFACKGYQFNTDWTPAATYEAGGTYTMSLEGGATHGGGSCQLSLACDGGLQFKVIKSMIGGCPLTTQYDFTIPQEFEQLSNGITCLFAWTWFNKVGNREMYMDCAVVDIVPPTRSSHSSHPMIPSSSNTVESRGVAHANAAAQALLASYPDMFVANLKSINDCVVKETFDVVFDDPGNDVEYGDGITPSSTPSFTGDECTGKGLLTAGSVSSSSSSSSSDSNLQPVDVHGDGKQPDQDVEDALNMYLKSLYKTGATSQQRKVLDSQDEDAQETSDDDCNTNDANYSLRQRATRQQRWASYRDLPASASDDTTSTPAVSGNSYTPDPVFAALLAKLNDLGSTVFTLVKFASTYLDSPPSSPATDTGLSTNDLDYHPITFNDLSSGSSKSSVSQRIRRALSQEGQDSDQDDDEDDTTSSAAVLDKASAGAIFQQLADISYEISNIGQSIYHEADAANKDTGVNPYADDRFSPVFAKLYDMGRTVNQLHRYIGNLSEPQPASNDTEEQQSTQNTPNTGMSDVEYYKSLCSVYACKEKREVGDTNADRSGLLDSITTPLTQLNDQMSELLHYVKEIAVAVAPQSQGSSSEDDIRPTDLQGPSRIEGSAHAGHRTWQGMNRTGHRPWHAFNHTLSNELSKRHAEPQYSSASTGSTSSSGADTDASEGAAAMFPNLNSNAESDDASADATTSGGDDDPSDFTGNTDTSANSNYQSSSGASPSFNWTSLYPDVEDNTSQSSEGVSSYSSSEPAFDWGAIYPDLDDDSSQSAQSTDDSADANADDDASSDQSESVDAGYESGPADSEDPGATASAPAFPEPSASANETDYAGADSFDDGTPTDDSNQSADESAAPEPSAAEAASGAADAQTLGEALKLAFPELAAEYGGQVSDRSTDENDDNWADGVFPGLLGRVDPSATVQSPPGPDSDEDVEALLPYFMGPGPVLPEGVSVDWPGPSETHASNLDTTPQLTNDLGPNSEAEVRKFFQALKLYAEGKGPEPDIIAKKRRDDSPQLLDPTDQLTGNDDDIEWLITLFPELRNERDPLNPGNNARKLRERQIPRLPTIEDFLGIASSAVIGDAAAPTPESSPESILEGPMIPAAAPTGGSPADAALGTPVNEGFTVQAAPTPASPPDAALDATLDATLNATLNAPPAPASPTPFPPPDAVLDTNLTSATTPTPAPPPPSAPALSTLNTTYTVILAQVTPTPDTSVSTTPSTLPHHDPKHP
ncbi:hypothetical protein N0V83_005874 [Neocucurbitaria cava]|uniref:Uncharacterized protein n=1 Tax=Neocucurbitaria cava TaxID=798079 RepID=A0A9W9CLP4_9PLEO|nr:hypothetical protein N0V83_005874 [Neocucurbitaria cava]